MWIKILVYKYLLIKYFIEKLFQSIFWALVNLQWKKKKQIQFMHIFEVLNDFLILWQVKIQNNRFLFFKRSYSHMFVIVNKENFQYLINRGGAGRRNTFSDQGAYHFIAFAKSVSKENFCKLFYK